MIITFKDKPLCNSIFLSKYTKLEIHSYKDEIINYKFFNDFLLIKSFYYKNNSFHREDGPALTKYNKNGTKEVEQYYLNGELHREDGPAKIFYDNDIVFKEEYYLDGNLKNNNGPCIIKYNQKGNIVYKSFITIIDNDTFIYDRLYDVNRNLLKEEYFKNNKRHRDNKPALINYKNGKVFEKIFFENGIKKEFFASNNIRPNYK